MDRTLLLIAVLLLGVCVLVYAHGDHHHEDDHHLHEHYDVDDDDDDTESKKSSSGADLPKLDPEEVEYHKGSLCGYCEYCKVRLSFLIKLQF